MKNLSIKFKVLIILLLLIVVMIVSMAWIMNRSFDKNFIKYRQNIEDKFNSNLVNSLQQYYQEFQSWEGMIDNKRLWNEMVHLSSIEAGDSESLGHRPPPPPPRHRPPPKRNQDTQAPNINHGQQVTKHRQALILPAALFDLDKNIIVGTKARINSGMKYLKIEFNNKIVGYLAVKPLDKLNNDLDQRFSSGIKEMLIRIGITMFLIAVFISFPLAKYVTERIKKINNATQKVASGDFSVRIESQQKDELGQLASNFNHLAKTLESNSQTQKTMMAVIAHELRTPVAVILSEIEAIQDGVHPANEKTFGLLHSQTSSLKNLINDLHELSESDLGSLKYKMQDLDLIALLQQSQQSFQNKFAQKGISLVTDLPKHACNIKGDVNRLNQLFNNLLNNAFDYTDSNGQVIIKLSTIKHDYRIEVSDSKPGLSKDQLEHIFDRWYRVEDSRNRNSGGSGLGLAISKEIIKAHNARIYAESSSLGGVNIIMEFHKS
jgi:two-component system sensor histidine kinase BaeS